MGRKNGFLKIRLVKSISDRKVLRTKKLRNVKIHHHAKIWVKNFEIEGVIYDLVILLVTKKKFLQPKFLSWYQVHLYKFSGQSDEKCAHGALITPLLTHLPSPLRK